MKPITLVTGASGALGSKIASHLIEEGRHVAAWGGANIPDLQGTVAAGKADLTCPEEASSMTGSLESNVGPIEALIHVAGASSNKLLLKEKPDEWEKVLSLNLSAARHCCQSVVRHMMLRKRGVIVLVGSLAARCPRMGQSAYAAAKGGLESFGRALAVELAPKGIRVHVLAPGFIDTPMTREIPSKEKESILQSLPQARMGTAEEVAHAASFLISTDASYMTGQVLRVDGGASC